MCPRQEYEQFYLQQTQTTQTQLTHIKTESSKAAFTSQITSRDTLRHNSYITTNTPIIFLYLLTTSVAMYSNQLKVCVSGQSDKITAVF